MIELAKYDGIFFIRSKNDEGIAYAIVFDTKTFMINPNRELVKFCCCSNSSNREGKAESDQNESSSLSSSSSSSSSSTPSSTGATTGGASTANNERVCRSCFIIRLPLTEIPENREIRLAEYHKKKYLYVLKLEMIFIFDHDPDEILTILKRLNVSKIVTPKGAILSAAQFFVDSFISFA
jgi:hypothetical protein